MKCIVENIFLFASSLILTPLGIALKISFGGFVRDSYFEILLLMYRDGLYAGFTGEKTGHRKIQFSQVP